MYSLSNRHRCSNRGVQHYSTAGATQTNNCYEPWEEIVEILNHLKLPWSTRASGAVHNCAGQLRIKIIMPTVPSYDVQYDHGIGIYPIDAGGDNSPGFCDLPKTSSKYLNAYFTKLGYSTEQIGIHR